MSLQVWLPLNGDLHNQGLLEDLSINSTNVSFLDNGKIGKCFTGRTGYFNVPYFTGKKQLSVAYWVKVNTATATDWLDVFRWYSTDGSTTSMSRNEFYTNCTKTGFWFAGSPNSISGKATTVGEWHHHAFAIDYSAGIAEFYINGESVGAVTGVYTTHYLTGENFMIGENGLDLFINDLRIYDHCLSPKEVKELSKGLVAHYPLNDGVGGENLLNSSESDSSLIRNSSTGTGSFEAAVWVGTLFGKTWMNNHLTPGQQYTLSYKVTCISRPTGTFTSTETRPMPILVHQGSGMSQSTIVIGGTKTTDIPEGESRTFITNFTFDTISESNEYYGLCLYTMLFKASSGNQRATFRISNLKLEEGSVATPWIPNPNDELYSTMGFDDVVVYDCSGYGHNGTITGNLGVSSESPRYGVTTYFNGSSYIKTLPGEFPWTNFETLTIAAWMKPTTTPSSYSGGIGIGHDAYNGYKAFSMSNHSGKFTADYANTSWAAVTSSYTMPLNAWHHYVTTLDDTTVKMYVDGDLIHTETIDWKTATLHSNPQIQIAVDLPGGDETYTGYYSDVRIYATALSAEDIKELYETSASVDSHGNFYAYEIQEV